MTDSQRLKLDALSTDQETIDALRTLFTDEIAGASPVTLNLPNEQIGANFRAREEAKRLVDAAFRKLTSLNNPNQHYKPNPAR